LDRVLDGIKQDIEDCGNAIDKYYKSKFMGEFPSYSTVFHIENHIPSEILQILPLGERVPESLQQLFTAYAGPPARLEYQDDLEG
jgi:hypothetical protein